MTGFSTFNVAVNIGYFSRNIYFCWVMWNCNSRRRRIIEFIEVCNTNKCLSFYFQYSLYIQIAMIDMQIDKWIRIGKEVLNIFVCVKEWNISNTISKDNALFYQEEIISLIQSNKYLILNSIFGKRIIWKCTFSLDGWITKFIWS